MRPTSFLAALLIGTATAAAAQAPAPAAAPAATAAAQLKPGATIYDTAGGEAATVDSVSGDLVVVSTGTNKVTMPMASFAAGPKGPVVSVTKAQLDEAAVKGAAEAAAAVKAKLVAGTPVRDVAGAAVLGTVKSIADPNVVIATKTGDVTVPANAFGTGPNGLIIRMTEAEFGAAAAAVAAPQAK